MTFLAHLASRAVNVPLMMLPSKLALISAILEDRIGVNVSELREMAALAPVPSTSRYAGELVPDPNDPRSAKPYRMTRNGVAIFPVIGSLVNRGSFLDVFSGITSYEKLKHDIAAAADDPDVFAVVIDFDTPGGQAVGAFEAADAVRSAASKKMVIGHVNGLCASAGYAIASACSRIIVSQSSVVGSIGVVLLHSEVSRKLDKEGVSTRLIYAGDRKVDGNPFEPLTDGVAIELQAEVDRFYSLFVACVAAGRSSLTKDAIRDTEARTYIGADAVAIGLADEVADFETVVADLNRISPFNHAPKLRGAAPGSAARRA